jgi:hypothetical protein
MCTWLLLHSTVYILSLCFPFASTSSFQSRIYKGRRSNPFSCRSFHSGCGDTGIACRDCNPLFSVHNQSFYQNREYKLHYIQQAPTYLSFDSTKNEPAHLSNNQHIKCRFRTVKTLLSAWRTNIVACNC